MEKIILSLIFAILCGNIASAQCNTYRFKEEQQGQYPALTDATVIGNDITAGTPLDFILLQDGTRVPFPKKDSTIAAEKAIPIGFDFAFNKKTYDRFVVSSNGFIILGEKGQTHIALTGVTEKGNIVLLDRSIGLAGGEKATYSSTENTAITGTQIRYKNTGNGTVKSLAVEFHKIGLINEIYGRNDFTYTLTLSEDNSIGFRFGEMNFGPNNRNAKFCIGLRETGSDVHYRQPANDRDANNYVSSYNDWSATNFTKNSNSCTILIGKRNEAGQFPKGTAWTFSYPTDCQAPETGFAIDFENILSNRFSVSVTSENVSCDGAMVVLSTEKLTEIPEDGESYENAYVFANGSMYKWGDFPASGWGFDIEEYEDDYDYYAIEPNTKYYISVFPYNYYCNGNTIVYGQPTVDSCLTPTTAPASISVTDRNENEIVMKVEANQEQQEIAIVATTLLDYTESHIYGNDHGAFGKPFADMQTGDTLWLENGSFGGTVIYIGKAKDTIRYTETEPNRIYYFAAFSKDTQNNYSTVYAATHTLSPASFPFEEDFKQHPAASEPYGWEGTTGFTVLNRNKAGIVYGQAAANPVLCLPAIPLPDNQNIRLVLTYLMFYNSNHHDYGIGRNLWKDNDSIIIEVSQNEEDFKPVYIIDKYTADDFEDGNTFITRNIVLKDLEAAPSRIRIRWATHFEQYPTIKIESIRLIDEPACDYPSLVNVPDTTVSSTDALIEWIPGSSEETHWNISYARIDSGNSLSWSDPKEITEKPYLLTDLEANTTYQVRIRAMCDLSTSSDWTYSREFTTSWNIPMKEDFDNLADDGAAYRAQFLLKTGWQTKQSPLKDTVWLGIVDENLRDRGFDLGEWKYATLKYGEEKQTNGSIIYICSYRQQSWLELPPLDFGNGTEGNTLGFDIAITDDYGERVDSVAKGTCLYIFHSTDNGRTYIANDSLAVFDYRQLMAFGDSAHVTIALDELKGYHRLAFFLTATSNYPDPKIYLDNIEVYATCSATKDLRYSDLTETSATLSWRNDPRVENWIVKRESTQGVSIFSVPNNPYTLKDLLPATTYKVSVSHLCGTDTAEWATVEFTTGGIPCNEATGLKTENISRNAAVLRWDGEAASYKLQIRKWNEEKPNPDSWTTYSADGNSLRVESLLAATTYVWRVQSVCGEAAGDTSAFSDTVCFTTQAITCFPPEGLAVAAADYRSVLLKWENSEAEAYMVSYRKTQETTYGNTLTVTGDSIRIMNLEPVTSYDFRIAAICAAGDTSLWSASVTGVTTAIPPCPQPSDLKSESITHNSARLGWKTEGNTECILRFRISSESVWDSVKNLKEPSYLLQNLQPNTAYSWSVMSLCSEDRHSEWAKQASFSTQKAGNDPRLDAAFRLYSDYGQLHILNPGRIAIERIEIFDRTGRLLQSHMIRNNDNVVIPTTLNGETVIVRILHGNRFAAYKILL